MDLRLPPLVALRAFEAAARHGSMRQAADALSVSHSVISRHVRNLEEWLGVTLFTSGRRTMTLTPAGRRYFTAISEGLDRIAVATEEIRPVVRARTLNIWCVPGLASRWLVPKLDVVRDIIPDVEISIRPTLDVPNLAKGEVDMLITYGAIDVAGLWQTRLMAPRVVPVASPGFVETFRKIAEARDLISAPLLHEVSADYWRQWFEANGVTPAAPLKGPRLWYLNSVLDAAKSGQGVALAPEIVVSNELRDGQLIALTDSRVRIGSYNLYTRREKIINRSLTKFREWVVGEFTNFENAAAAS